MKTIKFITMNQGGLLNQPYTNSTRISFSTVTEIKDGASRMLTGFYYCREGVIGNFMRFFNKEMDDDSLNDGYNERLFGSKEIPTKRTTIAIHFNASKKSGQDTEKLDAHAKRSVNLLNHYERRNKWFPSEVYEADHDAGRSDRIYLFKSSRWWMTSPHMFSLYLLLIRMGKNEFLDKIDKSTNSSEVLSLLKNGHKDSKDWGFFQGKHPERWNVLLDNRKKIYGEKDRQDTFSFHHDPYRVRVDGIYQLCAGASADKLTNKRFAELCKEAGLKF